MKSGDAMYMTKIKGAITTLVVILFLMGWLIYAVEEEGARNATLRTQLIESCERANDLRRETNEVIVSLQEFLRAAADVRADAGDVEVALQYRNMARSVDTVPIPQCDDIIATF